ncbi:hypothetical protein [Thiorhodococcus fuscus]|uniref:HEPN domain-containing protein n=1 Tax=Thiorhodococcus fuscus TaxID=527200 RepID=A0ABW4YDK1_9GAMM
MMSLVLFETHEKKLQRCLTDARGYHQRATQFATDGERASLVFNIAAVAIEAYLIALCARHEILPFNHDYGSLVTAAEEAVTFTPELKEAILSLDEIFGICSIEHYHHGTPAQIDADRTLRICDALSQMFEPPNAADTPSLRAGQV